MTRLSDGSNYFFLLLAPSGSNNFSVWKNVAGTRSQIGSAATVSITAGNTYTIGVSWSSNNFIATVNGASTLTGTDSFNSTATKHGVRFVSNGSDTDTVDNFLVTSQTTAGGGSGSACPLGKKVRLGANVVGVVKVTSVPAGGNPSLSIYFQHSCDDGQTWSDFAYLYNVTSPGTYYVPISTVAPGPASGLGPIVDGTNVSLSGNTCIQGPLGDRLRVRHTSTGGTSGFFMFHAYILP